MLEDVKRGKMSEEYFEALVMVVLDKLEEEYNTHVINISKFENNLEILHELEMIYKQIYDRGLTSRLERKLRKFELAPGYDMSTNARILVIKQKALEREKELKKKCAEELKTVNKIIKKL